MYQIEGNYVSTVVSMLTHNFFIDSSALNCVYNPLRLDLDTFLVQ